MRIPKKIKVDDSIYKVSLVNSKVVAKKYLGQVDTFKYTIRIAKKLPKDEIGETLIHEILHCIADKEKVGLKEESVEKLSHRLYQVLKDNHLKF